MKNNILFIGLNGFAGSGKDTVAKALRLMLSYDWDSFEMFKSTWEREAFKSNYATFGGFSPEDDICYCIAFADQLKHICSEMFGIPVECFYYNKENAWVDVSGTFEYTEKKPYSNIVTAEDYYYMMNSNIEPEKPTWMTLREVLVYVGTYVCQSLINKRCFINGVANKVKQIVSRNKNLKYVICTDVRFYHEMEFIKKMNGININIKREGVKQLDNIAEHDLDDEESFDFIINNDGTYDDLLMSLWDTVHNNDVFKNECVSVCSHDGSNNYLRKISDKKYITCFEYGLCRTIRDNGHILMIDPVGGPSISIGEIVDGIGYVSNIEHADTGGWIVSFV